MKIQGIAIIFILIILPITITLSEYANAQKEIIELELLYDSWLVNATYDALKAFQINTFNDETSDIANSKIESIEASANAFYNSIESNFRMQGYSKESLHNYIPALVYTMYDGYYLYSPYANIADINGNIDLDSNNIQYGFKPYVYYSCRYMLGGHSDFIINYSLDNYITVQGKINGEPVNGTGTYSGYLLTVADKQEGLGVYYNETTKDCYYNGIEIDFESELTDSLIEKDVDGNVILDDDGNPQTKAYRYIKLNGTKYYWDDEEEVIFYLLGGKKHIQETKYSDIYNTYVEKIRNNGSAKQYYIDAYYFSRWVKEKLSDLKVGNAVDNIHNNLKGDKIFDFENGNIEYPNSNFNLHRKEVIRNSIESNLSVAIANFNSYTNSTNFQMPKLKETEWEMLQNEVSIISFLQGLNLGGKLYNGYTVVTNNKTEEVVHEESIYISDGEYYHRINDKCLVEDISTPLPEIETKQILTASDIKAEPKEHYGGYVENYVSLNGTDVKWQIFHADEDNIYLIASDYIKNYEVRPGKMAYGVNGGDTEYKFSLELQSNGYSGIQDIDNSIVNSWLSKYQEYKEVNNINSEANINEKATAYLLDKDAWVEFTDNNGYAAYAVGGPTIELFVASYNATHPDKTIDINVSSEQGYELKWSTNSEYTYYLSGLDTSETLYVINDNSKANAMWIASPFLRGSDSVMIMNYNGWLQSSGYYNLNFGARPIICLKAETTKLEKQPGGTYKLIDGTNTPETGYNPHIPPTEKSFIGVLDLDFEIRKDGTTGAYYTQKSELGCYGSIIGQENVDNKYDSIYEYLANLDDSDESKALQRLYYTALGRERFGMFKVENPSNMQTILGDMSSSNVEETYLTASTITADDYGGYVTNYESLNETERGASIDWRIFHSDGKYIYLIADDYVDRTYVPKGKGNTSVGTSSSHPRGFTLAPYANYTGTADIDSDLASKLLSKFTSAGYTATSKHTNARATAYLLDTTRWSGFKDSTGYAEYAIGAPTLELYASSYNVTHPEITIDTQASIQAGYRVKWSTSSRYVNYISGIDKSDDLYVITDKTNAYGMWLASPSAYATSHLLSIRNDRTLYYYSYSNMSDLSGSRPIVCLNDSVQLRKQTDGTYILTD